MSCRGWMCPSPERPGDDIGRSDARPCDAGGDAASLHQGVLTSLQASANSTGKSFSQPRVFLGVAGAGANGTLVARLRPAKLRMPNRQYPTLLRRSIFASFAFQARTEKLSGNMTGVRLECRVVHSCLETEGASDYMRS